MGVQATSLIPFVPSGKSFSVAISFFEELGFAKAWQHEGLAGLRFGGAYFILQDIDVPTWQENQMLTLEVDDLDGYWRQLEEKDLPRRFAGSRVRPPTEFPWGREVHIVDPAGVCWHIRQAKPPVRDGGV